MVSAADGDSTDVSSDVSIVGNNITYTPAAAQASKTVTIVVKANDGIADSTGNVTITVTVGAAGGCRHYSTGIKCSQCQCNNRYNCHLELYI